MIVHQLFLVGLLLASISCVIIARNEEGNIATTLDALKGQVETAKITLVDDGSTDKTAEIASQKGCNIIKLPYHGENLAGTPQLSDRFNAGFKSSTSCDYLLILGSDDKLQPNYVQTIIDRMERDPSIVVASGMALGEETDRNAPRGSGRIIKMGFWRAVGGPKYPKLWCWEEWIVYKALSLGYKTVAYPDVRFQRQHSESRSRRKLVGDGRASYGLGLMPLYVMGRAFKTFLRSPREAVYYFTGYLQGFHARDERSDVKKWLEQYQKQRIRSIMQRRITQPIESALNALWIRQPTPT